MFEKMQSVLAVYQEGSFTRAAKKLYISQPALSAAVRQEEEKLGVRLFERGTSPLKLTPEGEYYIRQAEKINSIMQDSEAYFQNAGQGRLTLGGSSFFLTYIAPDLVKPFLEKYPKVQLFWKEMRNDELKSALLQGRINGFPEVDDIQDAGIERMVLSRERLVLAVPKSWPINKQLISFSLKETQLRNGNSCENALPVEKLRLFSDSPFVMMQEGNDTSRRVMSICGEAGFVPQPFCFLADQMMSSYFLCLKGAGAAFIRDTLPRFVSCHDQLLFYYIDHPDAERNIYLYTRSRDKQSALVRNFWRCAAHNFRVMA